MKRFILILALLLCSQSLHAQATYDNSNIGKCGNAISPACNSTTNLTVSILTGSGSNRAMTVWVSIDCGSADTAPTVSSVVHAGSQNLSQTKTMSTSARNRFDMWTLPAGTQPTSGTNNVVVTLSGNILTACSGHSKMDVVVLTSANVDQTTTYTATATNSGSGTSASATLASSGGTDLVVLAACAGSSFTGGLTGAGGSVKQSDADGDTDCGSFIVATFNGGVTAPAATISASDSWMAIDGSLKASGGSTFKPYSLPITGVGRKRDD